jgi:hypothetical protein
MILKKLAIKTTKKTKLLKNFLGIATVNKLNAKNNITEIILINNSRSSLSSEAENKLNVIPKIKKTTPTFRKISLK